MRIITLEEHYTTPNLVKYTAPSAKFIATDFFPKVTAELLDDDDARLAEMDTNGVDLQVLSLTVPGVQGEPDPVTAVELARDANDGLAQRIARHPQRFGGFCALPLQDPAAAADELERSVTQLGLVGAMVNGHTHGHYLDEDRFNVVWERAAALDVPLYLHPTNPFDQWHNLTGHPELIGPMWTFGVETATHALRLIFGGVFDRHPRARLILGHMGETLPFMLWRLDSRWEVIQHHGIELSKAPSDYIRQHMTITTSGVASDAPLIGAIEALGAENIMFAVDYPYERSGDAVDFLRNAPITEEQRALIGHQNAERLLRLPSQT